MFDITGTTKPTTRQIKDRTEGGDSRACVCACLWGYHSKGSGPWNKRKRRRRSEFGRGDLIRESFVSNLIGKDKMSPPLTVSLSSRLIEFQGANYFSCRL